MNRTRCPSCICGYDGITERKGIPSSKDMEQMNGESLVQILGELGIRIYVDGNQIPTISGNLIGICRQTRGRISKQLQNKQHILQKILSENQPE